MDSWIYQAARADEETEINVETKDANGSSSSTNESFVAEKDGKFVIPVPASTSVK